MFQYVSKNQAEYRSHFVESKGFVVHSILSPVGFLFYKVLSHFRASLPGRNIRWKWASRRTPRWTVCRFTSWIITCVWPTWQSTPAVQQSKPVQWSTREKHLEQEPSAADTATEREQHWSSCEEKKATSCKQNHISY